jgi:hypothetical protein
LTGHIPLLHSTVIPNAVKDLRLPFSASKWLGTYRYSQRCHPERSEGSAVAFQRLELAAKG